MTCFRPIGIAAVQAVRCLTVGLVLATGALSLAQETSPGTSIRPHLVFVSQANVLSLRIASGNDQSITGLDLEKLRFGDPKSLRLEEAFRAHLDRDGNGIITLAELQTAEHLLKSLDLDEDECLVPLEIAADLTVTAASKRTPPAKIEVVFISQFQQIEDLKQILVEFGQSETLPLDQPDITLTIDGANRSSLKLQKRPESAATVEHADQSSRYRVVKGLIDLDLWADANVTAQTGQPTDPVGAKPVGSITAKPPVAIQLRPGRRGWFEWLDANGDGRLSRAELHLTAKTLEHDSDLPRLENDGQSFAVRIGARGTMPRTFIPLLAASKIGGSGVGETLPWFAAMDTNGDGSVSQNEFLGGDLLFKKADSDGDGLLSITEAAALKNLAAAKGSTP